MSWWTLTLLALAVSLDGLWSGLAFGLRGIRISVLALFLIACVSGTAAFVTLSAGAFLAGAFSADMARLLGGAIMVTLGLWAIYRGYQDKDKGGETGHTTYAGHVPLGVGLSWRNLPLTRRAFGAFRSLLRHLLQVLRNPTLADADFSGIISISEALILALAVSLDGALAGFGAGLSGFHAVATTALMGFFQAGLQWLGNLLAVTLPATVRRNGHFHYLPGAILIVVGLLRIV